MEKKKHSTHILSHKIHKHSNLEYIVRKLILALLLYYFCSHTTESLPVTYDRININNFE